MAGNYSDAAKQAVLAWRASQITRISAHTADPGPTGANEVTGGSYARAIPSWGTATAAGVACGALSWTTSSTVTWLGLWSGSTYWGKVAAGGTIAPVAGVVTVASVTLNESVVASA